MECRGLSFESADACGAVSVQAGRPPALCHHSHFVGAGAIAPLTDTSSGSCGPEPGRHPRRFTSLFTGFAAGYTLHFSGDEAESYRRRLARIRGKHPSYDGIPPRRVSRPQAATVELLGWDHSDPERDYFGVDHRRTREALCGIVTAIFDFDAIDEAEVRDALTASVAVKDGLLRIHRQHLVEKARRAWTAERSATAAYTLRPWRRCRGGSCGRAVGDAPTAGRGR